MKIQKYKFKIIDSTNKKALDFIKKKNYKSGIVIAEYQKKGKGQYGKKWISYKGNIFMSIFFSLEKIDLSLKKLTKINCLLIKKTISKYIHKKISIKYPNDLLIDKKKFCGILQETIIKSNKKFIVVGIGINLIKSPNISEYQTTYLSKYAYRKIKKDKIIGDLINIYKEFLNSFIYSNKLKRS
tara:strand:- start:1722 stop:2273 length:552 start_codon:yes stop_codon:yes gene_type:complete